MDEEWFKGSVDYWKGVDATVNGMLGGYSIVHKPDIQDSHDFIQKYTPKDSSRRLVLDVGAGIGRVSQHLLAPLFDKVSILESDERFVGRAKEKLGFSLQDTFCQRLQDFRHDENIKYDLIWIQWVLLYGSDQEVLDFLSECKKSLAFNGFIAVKENTMNIPNTEEEEEPKVDLEDHSILRSPAAFRRLFKEAGFEIVGEAIQTKFPSYLFPVYMFMLESIQ